MVPVLLVLREDPISLFSGATEFALPIIDRLGLKKLVLPISSSGLLAAATEGVTL